MTRASLRCGPIVVLAVALSGFPSTAARADDRDDASQLFRAAQAAYDRGELRAAALAFAQAYQRFPSPVTKFDEGLAWYDAGELARAADAFALVADSADLPTASREDARRRLSELAPKLAIMSVRTSPEAALVSIAQASNVPAPLTLHLAPGTYALRVHAPGHLGDERRVVVTAGQVVELVVALPLPLPPAPAPPVVTPAPGRPWLALGWAGVGLGAAFLVTGAVVGEDFLSTRDRYGDGGKVSRDLYDQAGRERLWANVAYGAAAVVGGTGIALVTTSLLGGRADVHLTASGLALVGHF